MSNADCVTANKKKYSIIERRTHFRDKGGFADDSTNAKDLCELLKELINLEKLGKSFKCEFRVVAKDKLEIISRKLQIVKPLLEEQILDSLIKKVGTKLAHILNRPEKIESEVQTEVQEKSKLLTLTLSYVSILNNQIELNKNPEPLDLIFQNSILGSQ
ncbi:hypothetical protein FQA39_LY00387 [Lamprigera yunnana]|nr:hypothetical protein FQA39_LY00387 [Lamprigera yunnana]